MHIYICVTLLSYLALMLESSTLSKLIFASLHLGRHCGMACLWACKWLPSEWSGSVKMSDAEEFGNWEPCLGVALVLPTLYGSMWSHRVILSSDRKFSLEREKRMTEYSNSIC